MPAMSTQKSTMDEEDDFWILTADENYDANVNQPPFKLSEQAPLANVPDEFSWQYGDQPNPFFFGQPLPTNTNIMLVTNNDWSTEGAYNFGSQDGVIAPWRAAQLSWQAMNPEQTLCPADVSPQPAAPSLGVLEEDDTSLSFSEDDGSSQVSHIFEKQEAPQPSPAPETAPVPNARRKSLPKHRSICRSGSPPRHRSAPKPRPRVSPPSEEQRALRDRQLLHGRRLNWTYAEIRRHYNMPEAESTLRGRWRTLKRPAEHRLRTPTWTEKDVELLYEAVAAEIRGSKRGEIRWKGLAEDMVDAGASYPFSAHACKRKWEEGCEKN